MADYKLIYWSMPFRGQFVRAVLSYAGKNWTETDDGAISKLMNGPVRKMPVPFMGPPVLIDNTADVVLSEMPAIMLYLGETLGLLPSEPGPKAMAIKVVNDANDVIDEMTLNGGRDMWSEKRWKSSIPRIKKWMKLWEETGLRHGLRGDAGFLLGGDALGIADIATATLWTTMSDRFNRIETLLAETAPMTAALAQRISSLPALSKLADKARRDYGNDYAGGQIGASMARVLNSRRDAAR